ncbi:MAG: hypothetical protein AAF125_03415 [Chloroflexota bacterium]
MTTPDNTPESNKGYNPFAPFTWFFKTVLKGGLMAFGAVGACLCACALPLLLIGIGIGQQQAEVLALNNDRGTLEAPIARGEWARYTDLSLRATEIIPDATNHPDLLDGLDPAAAGSTYRMIWFQMSCRKDEGECLGSDFRVWLVDAQGREWQEPPNLLVFSRNDLDFEEAVGGNTIGGWQMFEVPTNADIDYIKFQRGGVTLYTRY